MTLRHAGSVAAILGSVAAGAAAQTDPHLARFGAGEGPSHVDGVYRLLDVARSPSQSNALAFDREHEGAHDQVIVRADVRVMEGGDGGAFLLLNTAEHGVRGPAPFVRSWVEPNLPGTFAVALDVHDPKNEEMFGEWGNYQGLPEREVSLHFDGRELVKRVAPSEFRGAWSELEVRVDHVSGGAEVTVRIGDGVVYDRYFVPRLLPYECRLAVGAGTREDATTEFDVRDVELAVGPPSAPRRPPLRVEVFNHVLTDNSRTTFEEEVDLPPAAFAFGRVLLTLEIHDAGQDWDEWDRNGHLYVVDDDGERWDIVPFITSYRTECRWEVDVTHFRPLLAGKRRFVIQAGTNFYKNRGYMMSVSLEYHHGTPSLSPFRVVPLWHGTARYRSEENHFRDFFDARRVEIPDETAGARVYITTTGHSQVGEFTPSAREVVVAPRAGEPTEARFANTLWRSDCYLNPNRPQFGTWKFARAGWAPGDVVRPWRIDLDRHIIPGETAELRYEPQPYDFDGVANPPAQAAVDQASHVVRAYLILYRTPTDLLPAPTLRVLSVEGGSHAAEAGIVAGDYLASYDAQWVDSLDALRDAKQAAVDAGRERVPVSVYRGVERLDLEIATGQLGVQLSSR